MLQQREIEEAAITLGKLDSPTLKFDIEVKIHESMLVQLGALAGHHRTGLGEALALLIERAQEDGGLFDVLVGMTREIEQARQAEASLA